MLRLPKWRSCCHTIWWRCCCELVLIAGILIYFALSPRLFDIPFCPFHHLWGVSCPTCGTTRSLWSIMHGDVLSAWTFNPVGFVVLIVLARRVATLLWPETRLMKAITGDIPSLLLLGGFFALGYAHAWHVL